MSPQESSHASVALKKKSGRQSERFLWTTEQEARIRSLIPTFESFVYNVNPQILKDSSSTKSINEWKDKQSLELMQDDLFKGLDTTENSRKHWQTAMKRIWANHFNRMKPRHIPSSSLSSSPATSHLPIVSQHDTAAKLMQKAFRNFIVFTGDVSPRELYAFEHQEELQERYQKLVQETGQNAGPTRQQVLSEMWKNAPQSDWEKKADEMAGDIPANREEFPALIIDALDRLCARGRLGTCIMSFSWAFRDEYDGLQSGTINSGYNIVTQTPIHQEPIWASEAKTMWEQHADAVLPRRPSSSKHPLIHIPQRLADGLPLFPKVDIMNGTITELVEIIKIYVQKLWSFRCLDPLSPGASSDVPWADLSAHPARYYDVNAFRLPTPLKLPQEYTDPRHVLDLAGYLYEATCNNRPFHFLVNPSDMDGPDPASLLSKAANSPTATPTDPPQVSSALAATPTAVKPPAPLPPMSPPEDPSQTTTAPALDDSEPSARSPESPSHKTATTPKIPVKTREELGEELQNLRKAKAKSFSTSTAAKRGTKRKSDSEVHPTASSSSVPEPRRSVRKCKAVEFGPRPIVDPTEPPKEYSKERWYYETVPVTPVEKGSTSKKQRRA